MESSSERGQVSKDSALAQLPGRPGRMRPGPGAWDRVKAQVRRRVTPAARVVGSTGITPDSLTLAGLGLNFAAAAIVAAGALTAGGIVFLLASAFDMLDGAVARAAGATSRFGAFLDSVADRYSEAAMFAALLVVFSQRQDTSLVVGSCLALTGSLLVSYARARAEGFGLECEIGVLQRPERVILLVAGLLFPDLLLAPVVWALAVVTNATVVQRVLHVRRVLIDESTHERGPTADRSR